MKTYVHMYLHTYVHAYIRTNIHAKSHLIAETYTELCTPFTFGSGRNSIPLRVHVPKQHILWAQCTYVGSTLRPMYILYEDMDPYGSVQNK